MKTRVLSIDILRGLTIFLMIVVNTPGSWSFVYPPLRHAAWHGCTLTDLVFPSFLFVVGLSMYISLRKIDPTQRATLYRKIIWRGALIFLIGVLLNWFPFYHKHISDLRIFGVLQRIALSFLGAGLLVVALRKIPWLIGAAAVLMLSHWGLLYYFGTGDPYALTTNFNGILDLMIMHPDHIYGGFKDAVGESVLFDPEGLLGTMTGIAHVLLGYVIGSKVLASGKPRLPEIKWLAMLDILFIAAAKLWDLTLPINKPLWTGSYVLYTIGILSLVWAALIWILDIKHWTGWAYIFRAFGKNPLISYILSGLLVKLCYTVFIVDGVGLNTWMYANFFQPVFGDSLGSFIYALSYTLLIWLFAWWLYRRGKVIKI